MDISGIASGATSIAETGTKQEVDIAVLKRAQEIESSTATQLLDAIKSTPTVQNLPAHLGKNVNTTA
ncbi:YjfB family protein [Massilia agilis]|uniref:YjfB family protein n=1 Tax=Massilia agilis TaxID=1811226 RepID=A0ABT2DC54_9BURK|nr:YjfB family protein [Massilia agilis]MCS0808742.1 YjfB family protein [Massilia agilis]